MSIVTEGIIIGTCIIVFGIYIFTVKIYVMIRDFLRSLD